MGRLHLCLTADGCTDFASQVRYSTAPFEPELTPERMVVWYRCPGASRRKVGGQIPGTRGDQRCSRVTPSRSRQEGNDSTEVNGDRRPALRLADKPRRLGRCRRETGGVGLRLCFNDETLLRQRVYKRLSTPRDFFIRPLMDGDDPWADLLWECVLKLPVVGVWETGYF